MLNPLQTQALLRPAERAVSQYREDRPLGDFLYRGPNAQEAVRNAIATQGAESETGAWQSNVSRNDMQRIRSQAEQNTRDHYARYTDRAMSDGFYRDGLDGATADDREHIGSLFTQEQALSHNFTDRKQGREDYGGRASRMDAGQDVVGLLQGAAPSAEFENDRLATLVLRENARQQDTWASVEQAGLADAWMHGKDHGTRVMRENPELVSTLAGQMEALKDHEQFGALLRNPKDGTDISVQATRSLVRYGVFDLNDLVVNQHGDVINRRTGYVMPEVVGGASAGDGYTYFHLKPVQIDESGRMGVIPVPRWDDSSDKAQIAGALGALTMVVTMGGAGSALGGAMGLSGATAGAVGNALINSTVSLLLGADLKDALAAAAVSAAAGYATDAAVGTLGAKAGVTTADVANLAKGGDAIAGYAPAQLQAVRDVAGRAAAIGKGVGIAGSAIVGQRPLSPTDLIGVSRAAYAALGG